jgi:putative membrane protein
MILWVKVFHILSLIAWMAALFYLPRLYVYHAGLVNQNDTAATFKVMERRLLKLIMTPAMIATWVFGIWLAILMGSFSSGWLHTKLLLVLILSGFHGFLSYALKQFAADRNRFSPRFWRFANEIPTILLVFIVILVVVKPF